MTSTHKCLAQNNKTPENGLSDQEAAPPLSVKLGVTRSEPKMTRRLTSTTPDVNINESIVRLQRHFGLTLAEARLALHLVTGETLRSAAAKLNINYETARTSLKKIFGKTGSCRQLELVLVILTALPDCLEVVRSKRPRQLQRVRT